MVSQGTKIRVSGESRSKDRQLGSGDGRSSKRSTVVRRRGRVRGREWYAFMRFFRRTVNYCLLLLLSGGKGRKRVKYCAPMLLAKVIGDVVHVPCGCWTAKISAEMLGGRNEITGNVHFVSAFDLTQAQYQYGSMMGSKVVYRGGNKG